MVLSETFPSYKWIQTANYMDKHLFRKLMHMSRLELSEQEQAQIGYDLAKLCTWIDKLQEVDTTSVMPLTTHLSDQPILREDQPSTPLSHEQALSGSLYSDSNYFRVPKVKS